MPLATVTEVAPQRTSLEQTLTDLHAALTVFNTTYYSGATPPTELSRLLASVSNMQVRIAALSTAHSHDDIADFSEAITELRDEIDNAQAIFVWHTAEWKRDVMSLAKKMEQQSEKYINKASGSWIRRKTRNWLNAVGLDEHRRDTTKRFLWRHKKIIGAAGAGAVLWWVLQMEWCSSSEQPPKENTSWEVDGAFKPRNKSEDKEWAKYDGGGKSFSVGWFLNASKDTFANGASPEAQAFQGVWNYITKNVDEDNWNPLVERFHFHTTPNKDLKDATHYDVNAYTGDHGTKIIEITWQKEHGKEESKKVDGVKITRVNEHTWRFILHTNGSIEKTDIFHNGKSPVSKKNITKAEFQDDLRDIQGF